MMKFRGLDFDFDFCDAECADAYEGALAKFQTAAKEARKADESLGDCIRRQCTAIFEFFDDVLGEGVHKEIFGERTNLAECLEAYREFVGLLSAQTEELNSTLAAMRPAATTPAPNRATRRAMPS